MNKRRQIVHQGAEDYPNIRVQQTNTSVQVIGERDPKPPPSGAHRGLHVALQDPVHLPRLPGGDLQSAIGEVLANVIHGNPLLGSAEATWKADADHEGECILDTHLLTLFAKITVILLVASMRLDQLGVLERDLARSDVVQTLLHATTQLLGLNLDLLICLHWAIIAATGGIGLVNTESGEQLALPLGEASVVLVCVLFTNHRVDMPGTTMGMDSGKCSLHPKP